MKITKIVRSSEKSHTFDVTTKSGAFALPNACVSHNSSVVLNSTNGISMVKELIVAKDSKAGSFVQVVPEYRRLKNHYQLLWDQKDCMEYIKTVAVIQAHTDQSISSDTWFNGKFYPNGKVDINDVIKVHMRSIKLGLKGHYYSLSNKQATIDALKDDAQSKVKVDVPPEEDDYCESCVL
jgi:ribonucleoside-diphosphate reductase alpha chain